MSAPAATYGAVCPGCLTRYAAPNLRGFIDVKRCPPCEKNRSKAMREIYGLQKPLDGPGGMVTECTT